MTGVSEGALIKRINRRLAPECQRLHKLRGDRWESTLGRYYIIDGIRNQAIASHCDLEEVARDLNVLRPGETLAEASQEDARS